MSKTLLPQTTISTAVTAALSSEMILPPDVANVLVFFDFNYGAGGTDITVFLQTAINIDGTDVWVDIVTFHATTAALEHIYNMNAGTAVTTAVIPKDGALSDNTSISGIVGDKLRVKYTSTGTYSGTTNIEVVVNLKSLTTDKMVRAPLA